MKKLWIFIMLLSLVVSSCVKLAPEPASDAPLFVTSTLPPTRPGLSLPTETQSSTTPDPSTTTTPGTPGTTEPTGAGIATGACNDSAVMIEDVTVPDNTVMTPGQKFTKTWRFLNNGKCSWSGYSIAFFAGDRMGTPDSVAVPATEAGKTVDVSVDLTAPSADGSYTGFYVLKNDKGETLPIGIEQSFWLKILIGNATPAPVATLPSTTNGTPVAGATVKGPPSCNYTSSSGYINEIASLINNARTQKGLPALTVNAQLNAAAQGHSIDMVCHNLLSHSGSDSSTVAERVAAAGYAASYSSEIIYGSGYPQTAFDWWMSDPTHRDEILNARYTEMGIGYAYKADTAYGSYFTVDFASP
jgi:uncharacterized protein YkwD